MSEFSNRKVKDGTSNPLEITKNEGIELKDYNVCGVKVYTNNANLGSNLQQINNPAGSTTASFVYLTGMPFPLYQDGSSIVSSMTGGSAGELYMQQNSLNFAFSGLERFASLIHLIYGINTYSRIAHAKVGLHASVVYDNHSQSCHAFVGPSQAGKSSIALALEMINPDRFEVLGDDWAEIDPDDQSIRIISPIFTSPDYIMSGRKLFEDHGKEYYASGKSGSINSLQYPSNRLSSITEVYPDKQLSHQIFFQKAMFNVPFVVNCDLDGNSPLQNITPDANNLIKYYWEMYNGLSKICNVSQLVNDKSRTLHALGNQFIKTNP